MADGGRIRREKGVSGSPDLFYGSCPIKCPDRPYVMGMDSRILLAATLVLTISVIDAPCADPTAAPAAIASAPADDSASGTAAYAPAPAVDSAPVAVPPAPATVAAPLPAPVAVAPASKAVPRAPLDKSHRLELLLDLFDIDGDQRLNQRHFNDEPKKSNFCCVDAAWIPWSRPDGFSLGVSGNLGQWSQDLTDRSVVQVTDLLVASSLGYRRLATGPWARVDLGISTLVVDRRTVGVDWGVGGALRAGWRIDKDTWALICGGAWDFRRYFNLDVKNVPALTLFVGAEL